MVETYVLDIETRPNPKIKDDVDYWAALGERLRPPKNYRNDLSIQDWRTGELEKIRSQMALKAHLGIVACIGVVNYDGGDPQVMCVKEETVEAETELLAAFARALDPWSAFIGWNIRNFDIPFLLARYSVAETREPAQGFLPMPKNWDRVIDLYETLGGTLNDWKIAHGLGPKEFDGEEVLTLPLAQLAEHCREDVATTLTIARRMNWAWQRRR